MKKNKLIIIIANIWIIILAIGIALFDLISLGNLNLLIILKNFLSYQSIGLLFVILSYLGILTAIIVRICKINSGFGLLLISILPIIRMSTNLSSYEYMLMNPFFYNILSWVIYIVSILLILLEFILNLVKNLKIQSFKQIINKKHAICMIISTLILLIAIHHVKLLSLLTLPYIDRGMQMNYFDYKNILWSSMVILFLLNSITILVLNLINKKANILWIIWQLIFASIYVLIYFWIPFVFWIGLQSLILLAFFIFYLFSTSKYSIRNL